MPKAFLPDQAEGVNAIIQFELTGEGGGNWYATIAEGQLATASGTAANPNMTLTASAEDYLSIINGDLSAMAAFMGGKVRIKGDVNLAMKFQKMFRSPSDAG
ncbi:MAG: SCP2 sterol-binding domain-containing protein [Chloroflexi bacterium]|nr:SCP2 sterol-binding domain-containing protein [Chloroflexota bacterium]